MFKCVYVFQFFLKHWYKGIALTIQYGPIANEIYRKISLINQLEMEQKPSNFRSKCDIIFSAYVTKGNPLTFIFFRDHKVDL